MSRLAILLLMLCVSCASYCPKAYKVIGVNQNYYTDFYNVEGDSVLFNETDWSGKAIRFYKFHYKEIVINKGGKNKKK